jgi:hypothetical protein
MNLAQRIIVWLGCNALFAVWLLPPTYLVHADGTRLESNWRYLWEVPLDWSVSVPLTALRLATVIVMTTGFFFVFRTNAKKEAAQ